MPARTTILPTGSIVYRTKNLPLDRAAAFARCIEANASRFRDVQICEASTAVPSFYVAFRPTSAKRQGDLYEQEWNVRKERAETEGENYLFFRDADKQGVTWVFNPISGETYEVTPFGCTCPDYYYRCEKAALHCKHIHALALQSDAGTLGQTDKVSESREARNARMARNISRDF